MHIIQIERALQFFRFQREKNSIKHSVLTPLDNYNGVITDLSHVLNCDILDSVANINYNYQITLWFRKSNHILS